MKLRWSLGKLELNQVRQYRNGATFYEIQKNAHAFLVAGGLGFEPRLTESESAVLPLNYPPIRDLPLIKPANAIAEIGWRAN